MLRTTATFESFEPRPGTLHAHRACRGIAERGHFRGHRTVHLVGGAAQGKTHLLHAIGNAVAGQVPPVAFTYVCAPDFVSAMLDHPESRPLGGLLEADVLLLDDADYLASRPATLSAACALLSQRERHGRTTVLAWYRSEEVRRLTPALTESGTASVVHIPEAGSSVDVEGVG